MSAEQRSEVRKELYGHLNQVAKEKIAGWQGLSPSDPVRVLLETVADFSTELYFQTRPETEKLFAAIPEYLGFDRKVPRGVRGVVQILRTKKTSEPISLPKGTELFTKDVGGRRRFQLTEEVQVLGIDPPQEQYEDGILYLGFSQLPKRTPLRWYLAATGISQLSLEQVEVALLEQGRWETLPLENALKGGGGFLTLRCEGRELTPEAYAGKSAIWFRLTHPEGEMPNVQLLLDAAEVEENMFVEEVEVGQVQSVPFETHTLPVVPSHTDFSIRIEGDQEAWKAVPSLEGAGENASLFRFDRGRNAITFGDGVKGRIPGPAGKKIFLKNVEHIGSEEMLPRESIVEIRADHPEITGVEQPFNFSVVHPREPEMKYRRRFRDELLTQHRASSPEDYVRMARSFSPLVEYAAAFPSPSDPQQVILKVAGARDEAIYDSLPIDLLSELQDEVQSRSLLGQKVEVGPAEERQVLLEARIRLASGQIKDEAWQLALRQKVESHLAAAFGPEGRGHLGGTIRRQEVILELERLAEIPAVVHLTLRDGESGVAAFALNLENGELPRFQVSLEMEGG